MVVYLNAASSNRANTVLGCLCKAVNEYGLPLIVQSDILYMGGENMLVTKFMLESPERGPGRGSDNGT